MSGALERHGLPGGALVLEITETSRVPDPDAAAGVLQRLRTAGVRVALDDFGTGYGTLAHLHLLPVDVVKLDRTLTTPDRSRRSGCAARWSPSPGRWACWSSPRGWRRCGRPPGCTGWAATSPRAGCTAGQWRCRTCGWCRRGCRDWNCHG